MKKAIEWIKAIVVGMAMVAWLVACELAGEFIGLAGATMLINGLNHKGIKIHKNDWKVIKNSVFRKV